MKNFGLFSFFLVYAISATNNNDVAMVQINIPADRQAQIQEAVNLLRAGKFNQSLDYVQQFINSPFVDLTDRLNLKNALQRAGHPSSAHLIFCNVTTSIGSILLSGALGRTIYNGDVSCGDAANLIGGGIAMILGIANFYLADHTNESFRREFDLTKSRSVQLIDDIS